MNLEQEQDEIEKILNLQPPEHPTVLKLNNIVEDLLHSIGCFCRNIVDCNLIEDTTSLFVKSEKSIFKIDQVLKSMETQLINLSTLM